MSALPFTTSAPNSLPSAKAVTVPPAEVSFKTILTIASSPYVISEAVAVNEGVDLANSKLMPAAVPWKVPLREPPELLFNV